MKRLKNTHSIEIHTLSDPYPLSAMIPTKCSCPGGGMGTRASLAANSFTVSSMSDKWQVLSWMERLTNDHVSDVILDGISAIRWSLLTTSDSL